MRLAAQVPTALLCCQAGSRTAALLRVPRATGGVSEQGVVPFLEGSYSVVESWGYSKYPYFREIAKQLLLLSHLHLVAVWHGVCGDLG